MTALRLLSAGAGALLFTLLASTGDARAQTGSYVERKTTEGQDIRFEDDPLGALGDTPVGAQLQGFHPPKRCALMRPRTTFVPELLKAVEHL